MKANLAKGLFKVFPWLTCNIRSASTESLASFYLPCFFLDSMIFLDKHEDIVKIFIMHILLNSLVFTTVSTTRL